MHVVDGERTARMADSMSASGISNFSVLEQRMDHIERGFVDIRDDIKSLRNEIMSYHKPQWQTWGIMAGLFMSMAVGAYTLAVIPIRDDIFDVKSSIKNMVPREEHMTKWAMYDKDVLEIKADIALLKADVGHKLDRVDVEQLRADLKAKIDELDDHIEAAKREEAQAANAARRR